jgi:glycosyltransferase involved in cell wall biosynthesis
MKVKILMHTHPNSTSFNAQDLNGIEIASRLDANIFEIYFIDTLNTPINQKLKKNNIKIISIKNKNRWLKKLNVLRFKLLNKFDISFYVSVFCIDSIFLTLLPFFDKNRKTIHMIENTLPYPNASKKYQICAKYNAKHSNHTIPISKKIQQDLKNLYGLTSNNIIHVGADTRLFKPVFEKNNSRLKIVSVGTFQKRKQPELFAKIAKQFADQDFYWIGEGELKDNIIAKKENEKIENLYLLDNMPHQELADFLARCDIFLFPSIHEGFPKVVVEAMASGLPAIVFDNYKPEAVIDAKTGFVVSSEKEMVLKLQKLIEDSQLRQEMSLNAVQRAKDFDWDIIVRKWEKTILDII